jgi:hypothetical protein
MQSFDCKMVDVLDKAGLYHALSNFNANLPNAERDQAGRKRSAVVSIVCCRKFTIAFEFSCSSC